MLQVEWYCDKCKENHFGNCPMLTVTMTATGFDSSESSGEPPTLRKLAPVSPNTNIDEARRIAAKYVNRQHWKGAVNRIRFLLAEDIEALLSAAKKESYEQGYDDRTLEADHELEDAVAAAQIEELKRAASHNNSEYTSDYLEERIKELEESQ